VRFDIQGSPRLDTSRVSKIEAISVGPKGSPALAAPTKSQAVGGKSLAPEIRTMTGSGGMAVSNLVFYLPQQYAAPFQQWFASSSSYTRNGSISYLKTNGTPWIILALNGLAIAKITTEPTTGADGIRLVKVEMTVGSLQLTMPH
jgi:hypothetical protein